MILRTPRLTLRGVRPADLEDLFEVFSDPEVMRYWSTPPHASAQVTQGNLFRQIRAAKQQLTYFVIEKDGRAIGNAGMYRAPEVGFILHREYWRQGIITEAMTAIIPYLFAETQVDALTADADPRNKASVAALVSLGFIETHRAENTFCIEGEWSDSVYFALPRPTASG